MLLDPLDLLGRLDAQKLECRRENIDYMAVLGTNSSFVLNTFRVIDDQRIASAAFAVGILLPELERRVCGLRPTERIISLGGSGRANLPNFVQVIRNSFLFG